MKNAPSCDSLHHFSPSVFSFGEYVCVYNVTTNICYGTTLNPNSILAIYKKAIVVSCDIPQISPLILRGSTVLPDHSGLMLIISDVLRTLNFLI